MIRFLDIIFSLAGLALAFPLFILISVISLFVFKSPIFIQKRLGKNEKVFLLIKFRSMPKATLELATHLIKDDSIPLWGKFLRRSKLDELPQLLNVLLGHMSLVGPRPNLQTQHELIILRRDQNIYSVRPGLTGIAQLKGVDMSNPVNLVAFDKELINSLSLRLYLVCLLKTLMGAGLGDRTTK